MYTNVTHGHKFEDRPRGGEEIAVCMGQQSAK